MKPLDILFLTENFPPETNAAATRVFERAVYWRRWGHDVTVVTTAPNFPSGRVFPGYRNCLRSVEYVQGIRVVRVMTYITANEGRLKRTLDFLSFLPAAFLGGLLERRPDVVVATSPQFFVVVTGYLLGLFKRRPFVFELGDLWPRSIVAVGAMRDGPLVRALEAVELFLYRNSAAVVALTDSFRINLIERGIDPRRIAVIRNGVDLSRYSPCPRDPALEAEAGLAGRFVAGYVGTHGMAHDLGNVLDAAERLRHDDSIRFLMVGAGAEREKLVRDASARRLGNVVFLPPQPKERMPAVWSLCNVALVHLRDDPAFAEVIPSKVFEAMGMGLPVLLAAPEGEASAIVERTGSGIAVPAGDPAALAEAVRRLAADPAWRATLAEASLATAPSHTREFQASAFAELLDRVVKGFGDTAHALRPGVPARAGAWAGSRPKVSIVTAVLNAAGTIRDAINSVLAQTYPDIELVVVDGGSTDGTLEILRGYGDRIHTLMTGRDKGIYDGLNKGVRAATGDIVGFVHSDDLFAYTDAVADVVAAFAMEDIDAVYADVEYVRPDDLSRTIRRFRSSRFRPELLGWGWMPAHPTLYLRREVYERHGLFDTSYRISGDFDFVARIFKSGELRHRYMRRTLLLMRHGGVSTRGFRSLLVLNREVLRACRENGIPTSYLRLYLKYFRKMFEYV